MSTPFSKACPTPFAVTLDILVWIIRKVLFLQKQQEGIFTAMSAKEDFTILIHKDTLYND